jgi:fumarylacetoacetate (FAA) hydrolase
MRLLTFVDPASGTLHVGALTRDARRVVDLTVVGLDDMFMAVERAANLARIAGHLVEHEGAVGHPVEQVRIVAPMPGARGVHLADAPAGRMSAAGRALAVVSDEPALAFTDPAPMLGPGDELRVRPGDRWALAVAAVLGAGGRDLPEERALAHVAGYAIAGRWLGEASSEASIQLGPWLVTPDDAGDGVDGDAPRAARIVVDGQPAAEGAWRVGAPFAPMIARASARFELRPGDVLTALVPAADGSPCAVSLSAGQAVRLEVQGLGALPARAV